MFSLVNIHIGCSVMLYWHKEFGTYVIHWYARCSLLSWI